MHSLYIYVCTKLKKHNNLVFQLVVVHVEHFHNWLESLSNLFSFYFQIANMYIWFAGNTVRVISIWKAPFEPLQRFFIAYFTVQSESQSHTSEKSPNVNCAKDDTRKMNRAYCWFDALDVETEWNCRLRVFMWGWNEKKGRLTDGVMCWPLHTEKRSVFEYIRDTQNQMLTNQPPFRLLVFFSFNSSIRSHISVAFWFTQISLWLCQVCAFFVSFSSSFLAQAIVDYFFLSHLFLILLFWISVVSARMSEDGL